MTEIVIYRNGKEYSLDNYGDDLPLSLQKSDFSDLNSRQYAYSQSVTLPLTANNLAAFGFVDMADATVGEQSFDCCVIVDGCEVVRFGRLDIVSASVGEVKVKISGGETNFLARLTRKDGNGKKRTLNDLDFSSWGSLMWTPEDIAADNGTTDKPFVGVVNWSASCDRSTQSYTPNIVDLRAQMPLVKLTSLLGALMRDCGYTLDLSRYDSNGDVMSAVNRAAVPFAAKVTRIVTAEHLGDKVEQWPTPDEDVEGYEAGEFMTQFNVSDNMLIGFIWDDNPDQSNFSMPIHLVSATASAYFDLSQHTFAHYDSGQMQSVTYYRLRYHCGDIGFYEFKVRYTVQANGVTIYANMTGETPISHNVTGVGMFADTFSHSVNAPEYVEIWFEAERPLQSAPIYLWDFSVEVTNYDSYVQTPTDIVRGSEVFVGDGNLPEIELKDFFMSFVRFVGGLVSVDEVNKVVSLSPISEAVARTGGADWSSKYHAPSGVITRQMDGIGARNNIALDKASNDVEDGNLVRVTEGFAYRLNERGARVYRSSTPNEQDALRGFEQGWDYYFALRNDIEEEGYTDTATFTGNGSGSKDVVKVGLTSVMASSQLGIAHIRAYDEQDAKWDKVDFCLVFRQEQIDPWDGVTLSYGAATATAADVMPYSASPYIETSDVFGSLPEEWSLAEWLKKYVYADYIAVAAEPLVIEDAELALTPMDIATADLTRPVYIERHGAWFALRKIKNFVVGKLTKVDLLKC